MEACAREDADRLKTDLGTHFYPLVFDVCDSTAIAQAAKETSDLLNGQHLAALINNAGIAIMGPLEFIPSEKIEQQFEVNVFGLLKVTQAFLPLLKATNGNAGKIINISSVSGRISSPFVALYSASKFAVEALSDGLRRELFIYGIDVISIQPGPTKSAIWDKSQGQGDAYLDTPYGDILKGFDQNVEGIEKRAIPTIKVAEKILLAIRKKRPKTRYIVAKNAAILRFISNLGPARIIDQLLTSRFKKYIRK